MRRVIQCHILTLINIHHIASLFSVCNRPVCESDAVAPLKTSFNIEIPFHFFLTIYLLLVYLLHNSEALKCFGIGGLKLDGMQSPAIAGLLIYLSA